MDKNNAPMVETFDLELPFRWRDNCWALWDFMVIQFVFLLRGCKMIDETTKESTEKRTRGTRIKKSK
jgi:hypothetical protein